MYQGVSQQPAAQRALEQCERLENGYPTVADGVRKRPPTQLVAKLSTGTPSNAKSHQYFRGDGEHNVIVVYESGVVNVWDGVTGAAKTVNVAADAGITAYVTSANGIDDLGMLTVADTTFIWNRSKTVATLASTLTAPAPKLFIHIKEGKSDTAYGVILNGTVAQIQSGTTASTNNTTYIASTLATQINTVLGAAWVATAFNTSIIEVRRVDNADFTFQAFDAAANSLMVAFKNSVERYSDLPRTFQEGAVVEVRGSGDSAGKNSFWVKYKTTAGAQSGVWEETVAPRAGEPTLLDPQTMPHKLVRQADGTFLLSRVAWNERLIGSTSNSTAKVPSFVGGKISCLFFYRSRLGILSNENIVMKRANDLYNFWPKTASAISDDDPIDVTANNTKVSTLRHAVPFQRQLMLFSNTSQFPLTGGEILSPKNARVDAATEYDCSALVPPVSSGQDLFFVFERASGAGAFSGVREYFVNQSAMTNDASEITAHVPQYIPRNIYKASVSSTEDLLLLLTKDQYNTVYFYKYLWDGDKRVQSAWGRWTFRTNDKILSAELDKTTVNFVIQRADGIWMERMELQSTAKTPGLAFQILLDTLGLANPTFTLYDSVTDETVCIAPYALTADVTTHLIVAGQGFGSRSGTIVPIKQKISATGYRLKGNWTGGDLYFGVPYGHQHTFSEQFIRDQNGAAITAGRLQLKHMTINFTNAVVFRADVEYGLNGKYLDGRETGSYTYNALMLGMAGSLIGSPVLRSGSFTFPVASRSTHCRITLVNDSPYPATFYSAEWEGLFTSRSRR
jgi:hypothetical protein